MSGGRACRSKPGGQDVSFKRASKPITSKCSASPGRRGRRSSALLRQARRSLGRTLLCLRTSSRLTITRDLTADGRKLLITCDAYRAQITLSVLELFKKNNIIVYSLPDYTSGKTQLCDTVLFGDFKPL
eukprot:IDg12154t1